MNATRAGFTLVEILVAMAILSLVITGAFQVLQSQGDAIRHQRATIDVQQTNRTVAAVLSAELREVTPSEGDLVMATAESLTVRLVRKMGVVCNPDTLASQLALWVLSDTFSRGDSVSVFADVDTLSATDDQWRDLAITATGGLDGSDQTVDPALGHAPCAAWDAATRGRITLSGVPSGVHRGAPIRSYEHLTYGLYQLDGQWMLGRHEPGDSVVPLAGPLLVAGTRRGLRFEYIDTLGTVVNPTTAALRRSVRRVRVTVRAAGDAGSESYSDSLVTQVYLRNN